MVTKEQCLLKRIMSDVEYGRNPGLTSEVIHSFNLGKKYSSDMIFLNDEKGLDEGLQGYSPSFIVYSLIGEDSEYNARDPFFTVNSGIHSIDAYDFEQMLDEEGLKRITGWDVVQFLDDSDAFDAFESFVYYNYPQQYKSMNVEAIEDYTTEQFFNANWDELAKSLMRQQVNEAKTVKLSGDDLRRMTNKILKEIVNKK